MLTNSCWVTVRYLFVVTQPRIVNYAVVALVSAITSHWTMILCNFLSGSFDRVVAVGLARLQDTSTRMPDLSCVVY